VPVVPSAALAAEQVGSGIDGSTLLVGLEMGTVLARGVSEPIEQVPHAPEPVQLAVLDLAPGTCCRLADEQAQQVIQAERRDLHRLRPGWIHDLRRQAVQQPGRVPREPRTGWARRGTSRVRQALRPAPAPGGVGRLQVPDPRQQGSPEQDCGAETPRPAPVGLQDGP
jgi:hypothetical protein